MEEAQNADQIEYTLMGKYEKLEQRRAVMWHPCVLMCTLILFLAAVALLAMLIALHSMPWLFQECPYELKRVYSETFADIHTIAFGSCVRSHKSLSIFDDIHADVVVFLGDNVYADTKDPNTMRVAYNRLSCRPEFQDLVRRTPYVLAIWDDHDYGDNDLGAENPIKPISQSLFSRFWNLTPSRKRKEGIYGNYRFRGSNGNVSIIMPDLRYFRDPLKECNPKQFIQSTALYCPTNGSMLGAAQWRWLENTIRASQLRDNLTIIASSLQFGHTPNGYESWNNFPRDRERLKGLLDPSKSLVISGDVHWAEISKFDGILDVTSSGFTEIDPNLQPNDNRLGMAVQEPNYGVIDLKSRTVSIFGIEHRRLLKVAF